MEEVNLFWDKTSLGRLEKLCILSYLENNHIVNLFSYNKTLSVIKHKNFNLIDANEIIEEKDKFYYRGKGDCPLGSIVGFSDIFRYELLYKRGGWYSDLDVINFKNLSSISSFEVVLRPHIKYNAISNVCRFPKNYELLKEIKVATINAINEENEDWSIPLKIFSNFISKNRLTTSIISPDKLGNDDDRFIHHLLFDSFLSSKDSIKNMYGVHLCKSGFSTGNWNMRAIYNFETPNPMSLLHFLYYKFGI